MTRVITFFLAVLFTVSTNAQNESVDPGKADLLAKLEAMEATIREYKSSVTAEESVDAESLSRFVDQVDSDLWGIREILYQEQEKAMEREIEMAEEEMNDFEEDVVEEEYDFDYKGDTNMKDEIMSSLIQKSKSTAFVLGWGINQMSGDNVIPHKVWGSSNWEVGIAWKRRLGDNSNTRLVYGVSLNTHYFRLDDTDFYAIEDDPSYATEDSDFYNKVKVGVRYIQIPLGLGIKTGSNTELFLGGHFGIKTKGYIKKFFDTDLDEDVEVYSKGDYGFNKINYGANVSFGGKHLRVFAKYDFNPLFKDGEKYNVYTIGIRRGY